MATMNAVRIHAYGGPEELRLEQAERPTPGAGEVLVKVEAAGINPVDIKTRAGGGVAGMLPESPFPLTVGWDVAGVVSEVGAGVTALKPGDAVYGMVNFPKAGGGYAEYVVAPAAELGIRPASLSAEEAAALPLVALTAWQVLDFAQVQPGQRVLIHAAAGGVGHVAVQLAKARGAFVVGTASARNQAFARELGVDEFVDYTAAPFEQQIAPVDVVFDAVGGEVLARSYAVLKPHGSLVSIVAAPPADLAAAHQGISRQLLVHAEPSHLAAISALVDAGRLRVVVEQVLPLAQAAEAHRVSQAGRVRGKLVLRVG
ncbi:NADP-dependent oxidoreductase [Chloroflexia bacterium SDU3-3]|nr:NADP-dependent oxidoreductase [Chloroflexia bacterium SDU3-3]